MVWRLVRSGGNALETVIPVLEYVCAPSKLMYAVSYPLLPSIAPAKRSGSATACKLCKCVSGKSRKSHVSRWFSGAEFTKRMGPFLLVSDFRRFGFNLSNFCYCFKPSAALGVIASQLGSDVCACQAEAIADQLGE